MTDPVDADALRDMGAALTNDGHPFGFRVTAAADEVDRLRAKNAEQRRLLFHYCNDKELQNQLLRTAIENAPHDPLCNQPDYPCRCWKAAVL